MKMEGHHFGPDSHQVRAAVQELDFAMQALNRKIKVSNITFNVILNYS